MGEVKHMAAKAVNEQKGWSGSFIEIVNARAVNVDEASARRQPLLRLPRRPGREQDKARHDEAGECDDNTPDPRDHGFAPCPSQFQ
jgi:hypothetical protein